MKNPFASMTNVHDWIGVEWAASLRQTLESLTGSVIDVSKGHLAGPSTDGAVFVWWRQRLAGAEQAQLAVGAPERTWRQLARSVLSAAGLDGDNDDELRQTYCELLEQALRGFLVAAGATAGREPTGGEMELISAPDGGPWLQFDIGGTIDSAIYLAYPDTISELIGKRRADGEIATIAQDATTATPMSPTPSSIEVLYDVELPVSISFGRARLPLKEVLKLTSGSIVELNRAISEPVDVVVNNRVIARGEVVVVEGNYGVRILDIGNSRDQLKLNR